MCVLALYSVHVQKDPRLFSHELIAFVRSEGQHLDEIFNYERKMFSCVNIIDLIIYPNFCLLCTVKTAAFNTRL